MTGQSQIIASAMVTMDIAGNVIVTPNISAIVIVILDKVRSHRRDSAIDVGRRRMVKTTDDQRS